MIKDIKTKSKSISIFGYTFFKGIFFKGVSKSIFWL